jgi:TRAP-type C4-dicarboxylate transport system permease small subunit
MNEEPRPRKTEFFAGTMIVLFSGVFLWPAVHGRTTTFKGATVAPWQSACVGTVFLVIGIFLLARSFKCAFRSMQHTTSLKTGDDAAEPDVRR